MRTDDTPAGQASMIVAAEVSDLELQRRAARGDEAAFTAIYRRHEGSVYRFALRMSGSETVAEEVTQEVFLFLIRQPERYCPEKGTLGAFLIGVARNVAMKLRERAGRETALSDVEIAAGDSGLPEAVEKNDEIEFVQRAVLALPRHYREAVVLCELEDMSYEEAAAALGVPVGTLRSRLNRARGLLREKLARREFQRCLA